MELVHVDFSRINVLPCFALAYVGSPVYYHFCFASTAGQIKECSRKLNQHGHEWTMRQDKHAAERQEELMAFCELVLQDRDLNDETAEYNRSKDLACNPNNNSYIAAQQTLAESTGGGNYDRF